MSYANWTSAGFWLLILLSGGNITTCSGRGGGNINHNYTVIIQDMSNNLFGSWALPCGSPGYSHARSEILKFSRLGTVL